MNRGFTLFELTLVILVIAIAAALALPDLIPVVRTQSLSSSGDALASFVARARFEAIARRRCTRVTLQDAHTLVLEELNSFDCENPVAFDATKPLYAKLATLRSAGGISFAFHVVPTDLPTAEPGSPPEPAQQLRFRPTGRVFQAIGGPLDDDDVSLRANGTGGAFHEVVVEAQGLICLLPANTTAGPGHDLECP
jgi:prepilin-type N-terminal cleavage/methylation domain-containing protein